MLTFIEVPSELVVGAALNDVSHVLRLLVDRHGPDRRAWGRRCGHLNLDGARLGNLAIQLLQKWGVLEGEGCWVRITAQSCMLSELAPFHRAAFPSL